MRMHVAHRMEKLLHLSLSGPNDPRVSVPGRGYSKGRGKIQVFFSIGIPNVNTPRAFPHDGPRTIRRDKGYIRRLVQTQSVEYLLSPHFNDSPIHNSPISRCNHVTM